MDEERLIRVLSEERLRFAHCKEMVTAYYDRVTEGYRQRWGDSFHLPVFTNASTLSEAIAGIERRIAHEGGFDAGSRLLDVGCGVGGPTLTIAQLTGARMWGVNLVRHQVEIARQRAADAGLQHRVSFSVADAMSLPFADGHFDGVTVFESGCHIPDKAAFYRECGRVLRRGGRFVGIDWMAASAVTQAEIDRYLEPICRLHGIPGLITAEDFRRYLDMASLKLDTLDDLTAYTGLCQAEVPTAPDWASVFSNGIPPVQMWLSLGGAALALAARARAFVLCHWSARRV